MATVKQTLSASVEFGGKLDPSWSGSIKAMEHGVGLLTTRSRQLAGEQRALKARMLEAAKAGKDVSTLQYRYDHLTKSIRQTEKAQEALNGKLSKARKMERVTGGLKSAGSKALSGATSAMPWMIGGAVGAMAAPIAMNQETAEKAGLAKSYGVDASTFVAWDEMGKQMGLNGENIGDLFEEYKNKVSDNADDSSKGAIAEAFPELGIKPGEMQGLNNEQQMEKLFDKLFQMKDDQRAAGLADKLFGGEGNKVLTYMRMTGKSYQDLMAQQKRYTLLTEEGASGAVAGNMAFSNLWSVITTGAMEIAGVMGGELSPSITGIADKLSAWMKDGGMEKIKSVIRDDIIPGAIAFGKGLVYVGTVAFALAKKLGEWVLPDEEEQKENKQKLLNQVAAGNSSPEMMAGMAEDLDLGDWYADLMKDPSKVAKLREQWKVSHQGGNGASPEEQQKLMDIADPDVGKEFGALGAGLQGLLSPTSPAALAPASTPSTDPNAVSATPITDAVSSDQGGSKGNVHNEYKPNVSIQVIQQPGEDGAALANRVGMAFKEAGGGAGGFTGMADLAWGGG